jgi:hypothetical protein
MRQRKVIVFDGHHWYVRALRLSVHDGENDEMVYHCDRPISGPHENLAMVPEVSALQPIGWESEA